MNIDSLWAKTDPLESLPSHMKTVGNVAVRILTNSAYDGLLENMCQWTGFDRETVLRSVKYIAAIHDIGKAHPSFQCKNNKPLPVGYEDEKVPHFRHERIVLNMAPILWRDWDYTTKEFIATVLSRHHQYTNRDALLPTNRKWFDLWFEIDKEIRKWAEFENISLVDAPDTDAFCTILTGLIIISDWIASSQNVEEAFHAMNFYHHDSLAPLHFENCFGNTPRDLQQKVMQKFDAMTEMPLTTIIEAPPGEGKTELAIWLAHKIGKYWNKNGIYFALPTAATSNQMVERVQEYLKDDVTLMHSMEWLQDRDVRLSSDEQKIRDEWKQPIKRGILSRYAVGTVDQIMLSVLKVRYGVLRLFGLSNKVVIIDEIHAYDAYMTEVIKRLVEWLNTLRIPVIMLSATLPAERKQALLDIENPLEKYPLVTCIYQDKAIKQFAVDQVYRHMNSKIEIVEGFNNITLPDGMNCILVNTVEKAQKIYSQIKGPKILFHSRFPAKLRKQIEEEVLSLFGKGGKRGNCTLVATQIVEQSLDLDFDYLITELAPIDLIIQRMGRLQRFDIPGRKPPKCTIFYESENGLEFGKSEYVYHKLLLKRTKEVLEKISTLDIPNDIRPMIEEVYSPEINADELEEFLTRNQEIKSQQGAAKISTLDKPTKDSFCLVEDFSLAEDDGYAAKTRLSAGYKLCILPKDLYDIAISGKATVAQAKKISEYAIPTIKEYKGVDGEGKLMGYRFRIGDANSPTETSKSIVDDECLIMNKEIGLCLM